MIKAIKIENIRIPRCDFNGKGTKKVLIVAGIHGGENTAIQVANLLVDYLRTKKTKGLITVLPLINISGYQTQTRNNPKDSKNINASGTVQGIKPKPYTISDKIADKLVALAGGYDYYIDLHSASSARYLQHCYFCSSEDAELARDFGTNFTVLAQYSRIGTSNKGIAIDTRVKQKYNIPSFALELGGGEVVYQEDVERGLKSVLSFLKRNGFIDGFFPLARTNPSQVYKVPREKLMFIKRISEIGNFYFRKGVGETIEKNEEIGYLVNPKSKKEKSYKCPQAGRIIYQRIRCQIGKEDVGKNVLYKIFPKDNKKI